MGSASRNHDLLRCRVAENERVVSVAKIDESEEEEIEAEGGDELAPEEGATIGESELERPADPEPEPE